MTLFLDTSQNNKINLRIEDCNKLIAKKTFSARFKQAEKLLVEIEKLLIKNNIKLELINELKVTNLGSSFTSLRIGIITANALSYSLNVVVKSDTQDENNIKNNKFSIIKPIYDREPNITIKTNI
jgi:tRNA A37 threonylcarbamoyladenosine modification protein TsaB